MRTYLSIATLLTAASIGFSFPAHAQRKLPLPGCEPLPEVRKALEDRLDPKLLDRMKFPDRVARKRNMLEELIAKYPRELAPRELLRDLLHQYVSDEYQSLRDRWVKMAQDSPDDPLALLLAGEALWSKNTAESIRLFEASKAMAPNFPWPERELAGVYSSGKYADVTKAKDNLEAFFSACPASTDGFAQWLLNKTPSLQPNFAVALRARLEKETDPKRLMDYKKLWGWEFRTRPTQEHGALRTQISRDLERLEALNAKRDAEWQAFLINGYKQSGASKGAITAMEDRLIREHPHSNEAFGIVSDRWDESYKEPENQNDVTAWAKYQKEYEETLKGWIRDYPDNAYLQRHAWFDSIQDDYSISEKDGIPALDAFLQSVNDFDGPTWFGFYYPVAAQFLLERGWQPTRALELLKQARTSVEKVRARDRDDDNLTDDELKQGKDAQYQQDLRLDGLMLKAATLAKRPDEALKLQASIETPPAAERRSQSQYWWNRARFDAMQSRMQDALAYYQLALQTRTDSPKPSHGKLRDDLNDEAHALWKAQGGTEVAWDVWSKPASGGKDQLADGRWEKPTRALPLFELTDLSGKTWRLKDLQGKALLINVWATWCGPCQAELPNLQKLYEKVKDRSDIQVLTLNIDVDLGLVMPYLKEKGYTFPVMPAYSAGVLDDFGVPQNWVVDPHGIWRWKQFGYDGGTASDFEKNMLSRLEAAKAEQ